ncbi:MAG: hypothetical protein AB1491_12930 [Thermodesulfobacteriota bacterium]
MEIGRESIICPGCGCLCDDLDVTSDGEQVLEVANVCLWGVSRFLTTKKFHPRKERRRLDKPGLRVKGRSQAVTYEAALDRAAELLRRARRPLIYGLTNSGSHAQEAALRLARALGARLEPADLAFMAPYYASLKKHGLYWAPLEVLRDEVEAVLFWGANPLHSCPRQVVRYTAFARGRFTERGVEDRRVGAVDIYRTEIAKFCQLFLEIEPGQELPLIQGVRARLTGEQEITPRVKGTKRLADFLGKAGYGAIFCGRGVSYAPAAAELFDQLMGLTAWLNQRAPFVLFPLAGDFNSAGLYHLLLRELGSPYAPDFGDPSGLAFQPAPVEFSQVDAVLVTGADLFWFLPEDQQQELKRRQVPVIALSPFANRTTGAAQVVLPVALVGVEAEEVAYRMDGLPVALKQLVPCAWPTDRQVLDNLAALV